MKTAKELMVMIAQGRHTIPRVSGLRQDEMSGDFGDIGFLARLLAAREAILARQLISKMKTAEHAQRSGNDNSAVFNAWNMQESDLVQAVALSFVEATTMDALVRAVEEVEGVRPLALLYAVDIVHSEVGFFMKHGILGISGAEGIEHALKTLCASIGSALPYYVEGFGIPEHLIAAPIAGDWVASSPVPSSAAHARL